MTTVIKCLSLNNDILNANMTLFKVPVKSKLNLFTLLAHITSLVVNN